MIDSFNFEFKKENNLNLIRLNASKKQCTVCKCKRLRRNLYFIIGKSWELANQHVAKVLVGENCTAGKFVALDDAPKSRIQISPFNRVRDSPFPTRVCRYLTSQLGVLLLRKLTCIFIQILHSIFLGCRCP